MAKRFKARRRRSGGYRRRIARGGSAARKWAKQRESTFEDAVIGLVVGGGEGFVEANRENQGKQARFVLGGDAKTGLDKKGKKAHQVSVGNIAAVGGAAIALKSRNQKTVGRAGAVMTAGTALSGRRFAYDWEKARAK